MLRSKYQFGQELLGRCFVCGAFNGVGILGGILSFLFIFLPRHEHYVMTEERWLPLGALALLGVMSTALAQLFFYKLIKNTSAIFASSTTYIIPIVAVMWGLLDGEVFHWVHAISIAGILTAVVLIRKE
ncbi:MAG: EamA family transporter [Bacteroidetes bacterium]|nr:EamA family transporter [Bacteroidota bacterium]